MVFCGCVLCYPNGSNARVQNLKTPLVSVPDAPADIYLKDFRVAQLLKTDNFHYQTILK